MIEIDLVVIGRNCMTSITQVYGSDDYRRAISKFFKKCIYVDSASTDASIPHMAGLGFDCYFLEAWGRLSPAAGRYLGTLVSTSEFILFIDGDMRIDDLGGFEKGLSEFLQTSSEDASICGVTGMVTDHYPDHSIRNRGFSVEKDGSIKAFGGFVLLDRQTLLDAGGWNKDVLANEELELNARLHKMGKRVIGIPKLRVRHYTFVASPLRELLGAYLPLRPDRFGGMGMALRASWKAGSFWFFFAKNPESFILFTLCIVWAWAGFHHLPLVVFLTLIPYSLWVMKNRGLPFLLVVPSYLVAGWVGVFRYRELPIFWGKYDKSN